MSFVSLIIGLVGPVMARWLASMGLSLVVMGGLAAAVSTLRGSLLASVGTIPADAVGLAGLLGLWECLGMTLGAVTFCVTWASTAGMWRLGKA